MLTVRKEVLNGNGTMFEGHDFLFNVFFLLCLLVIVIQPFDVTKDYLYLESEECIKHKIQGRTKGTKRYSPSKIF